jgi:hypothetical protein
MNVGNLGFLELITFLLVLGLPVALLVWFVRALAGMAVSLREIAERL